MEETTNNSFTAAAAAAEAEAEKIPKIQKKTMEETTNNSAGWEVELVKIKTMERESYVCNWKPLRNLQNQHTHDKSKPRIPCFYESCSKTFRDKRALRRHLQMKGPCLFLCVECGQRFAYKSKFEQHKLTHIDEKPFQCNFKGCGKGFSLDSNLREHMQTHTGKRPYACEFDGCKKKFAYAANLKRHMLIHKKENKKEEEEEDDDDSSWSTI